MTDAQKNIIGTGQIGHMILGSIKEQATLLKIKTVMDEKSGVVELLADGTPSLPPEIIHGLPDDYEMASGSSIIAPNANYILFEDGFKEKT